MKQVHDDSKLVPLQEEEYHNFAKNHPNANFLNSIYAGRRMSQNGWKVEYLGLKNEGKLNSAVMLASRSVHVGTYFYAPRGFLVNYEDEKQVESFAVLLKNYMKQQHGVMCKMDPYVLYQKRDLNGEPVSGYVKNDALIQQLESLEYHHQGLSIGYSSSQCRWMSVLDLQGKTMETIFKNCSYKTRQDIRKAQKSYLHVRPLKYEELTIMANMEASSAQHQQFTPMSLSYFQQIYQVYGDCCKVLYAYLDVGEYAEELKKQKQKNNQEIAKLKLSLEDTNQSEKKMKRLKEAEIVKRSLLKKEAELEEIRKNYDKELPLASALFIKYGNEVVYLDGGSAFEYRHLKGSYAIQWMMLQEAVEEHYSYYNFYGISGYFQSDEQGFGVFDYKRGFDAEVYELVGDFILTLSKPRAFLYRLIKKMRG